jgi:hypothetical protein
VDHRHAEVVTPLAEWSAADNLGESRGKRDFLEQTGGCNDWLGLPVKFTDLALGQPSR